jgi:hypothetical protein
LLRSIASPPRAHHASGAGFTCKFTAQVQLGQAHLAAAQQQAAQEQTRRKIITPIGPPGMQV